MREEVKIFFWGGAFWKLLRQERGFQGVEESSYFLVSFRAKYAEWSSTGLVGERYFELQRALEKGRT